MSLRARLSTYWCAFQERLFPTIEQDLGPLGERYQSFCPVTVLDRHYQGLARPAPTFSRGDRYTTRTAAGCWSYVPRDGHGSFSRVRGRGRARSVEALAGGRTPAGNRLVGGAPCSAIWSPQAPGRRQVSPGRSAAGSDMRLTRPDPAGCSSAYAWRGRPDNGGTPGGLRRWRARLIAKARAHSRSTELATRPRAARGFFRFQGAGERLIAPTTLATTRVVPGQPRGHGAESLSGAAAGRVSARCPAKRPSRGPLPRALRAPCRAAYTRR